LVLFGKISKIKRLFYRGWRVKDVDKKISQGSFCTPEYFAGGVPAGVPRGEYGRGLRDRNAE
jgi:hypothetical protein